MMHLNMSESYTWRLGWGFHEYRLVREETLREPRKGKRRVGRGDRMYREATIWFLLERALGTPCRVGLPVYPHWFLKVRGEEDRQRHI